MRQALRDLAASGQDLPAGVDPALLTLGNVRTDIPSIDLDRRISLWKVAAMIAEGIGCRQANHPVHAMRCRGQAVAEAYAQMREIVAEKMAAGCDSKHSWQDRALRFGSALHTLQDSYCTGHAQRIDNADPHAPIIDMFTYPSHQHPIISKKDDPWQDRAKTAFKPEAAAAISATVAALKIFVAQSPGAIEGFMEQYLSFRADIAKAHHPD
ncbi:MAG: hypothetical protein GYB66_01620 [Chloroflexi bacterium]|nr:hypothetical protein [Chloroflexota bacterium]